MEDWRLSWRRRWPGIGAAAGLAVVAWLVGERISWLGGAGAGIVLGVIVTSARPLPELLRPGLTYDMTDGLG